MYRLATVHSVTDDGRTDTQTTLSCQ